MFVQQVFFVELFHWHFILSLVSYDYGN